MGVFADGAFIGVVRQQLREQLSILGLPLGVGRQQDKSGSVILDFWITVGEYAATYRVHTP